MSWEGFKKQFNKANQYMSEKIGGAKGTELDEEFVEMERKIDVMGKLVDDLIAKTQEFLQPNPGACLIESGEVFKQLADHKYSLEDTVKQNFLGPLADLQSKDLKEVNHHRKKLSGRRLDFDCKRRKKDKGSNVTDEEIRVAEEKFEESRALTETAMHNLLENEVEQIAQLQAFIEAEQDYHKAATELLGDLLDNIEQKRNEALSRPKTEFVPKRTSVSRSSSGSNHMYDTADSYTFNHSSPSQTKKEPCVKALYDFEPENEGELGFLEGQTIKLISQIDDNWFEGSLNGQTGFFPVNYVEIIVDLPH